MSAPSLRDAFRVGLAVVGSTVSKATGAILLTLADTFHQTQESVTAELWNPGGWLYRPSNPAPIKNDGTSGASSTGAAEAFTIRRGDRDIVLGLRDERGQKLAGNLGPGEFCAYAPGPNGSSQGRILGKGDGSIAMYALQGNVQGGASVTVQVLPSGNINIAGPFGGISISNGNVTMLSAGGGGVQLTSSGVAITGQTVTVNGSVVLGDAGATGVATFQSMTLMMGALAAQSVALTAMLTKANVSGAVGVAAIDPSGALGTALGTAAALVSAAAISPATFSLKVQAS